MVIVGGMRKSGAAFDIAKRENSFGSALKFIVDPDIALLIGINSCQVQSKRLGFVRPANGQQYMRAALRPPFAQLVQHHCDASAGIFFHAQRFCGGQDAHSLVFEYLPEFSCHIIIFPGKKSRSLLNYSHPAAKS